MKLNLLFLLLSFSVLAEYRVYEYVVQNKVQTQDMPASQNVRSTLPPTSYRAYHGGETIKLSMLRTWICPGHTGLRRKICDSPYEMIMKSEEQKL